MSVRSESSTSKQTQASIPIHIMLSNKQRKEFSPVCWIGLQGLTWIQHVQYSQISVWLTFIVWLRLAMLQLSKALKSVVSDAFPFGAIHQAPAPRNDTQAPQWVWTQRWQRQQGPAGGQRHVRLRRSSRPWRLWLGSTIGLTARIARSLT